MEFVCEMPIRFGDIDQAGIVYAPNFLHYYHCAFEQFFGEAHGVPYSEWLRQRRVGFPTVQVKAGFQVPLLYGDPLEIALTVPRIGSSSVDFRFEGRKKGQLCAWSVDTKVCVNMDTLQSVPLPDDLVEVLGRHQPPTSESQS